jgi:hypothetical protein
MLEKIHNDLELPPFKYDFNNIKQTIIEYDFEHGFAPNTLHKIKEGKLTSPQPRKEGIFNEADINQLEQNYKDITQFIKSHSQ